MLSQPVVGEECPASETFDILYKGGEDTPPSSPSKRLASSILSLLTDEPQDERSISAGRSIAKYLAELSPEERSALITSPQVGHYLHRLVKHAAKNHIHDELIKNLAGYFPSKMEYFKEKELPHSYSYSSIELSTTKGVVSPQRKSAPVFQYKASRLAATFRAPQLNLEDIRRASAAVALEVKVLDKSMCSGSGDPTIRSLDLHRKESKAKKYVKFGPSKDTVPERPMLVPLTKSELDDPQFKTSKSGTSLFPQKQRSSPLPPQMSPVSVGGIPLKNAFDVIEAFASGLLQSEAESVYLNYSNLDHCSPYDLSVTLRTKVKPEYFIISNFGIIHVFPDGTSDFQTFAEWLREASMFTLMKQIPFFREYKLKRAFWQWHRAVRSAKFHRLLEKMNCISIRFFPVYADALLKLQHLSEELMTVPFHHLKPLGKYTLDAMEHSLQGSQKKAHQFLQKYFKYCRRIVCGAVDSSRKHTSDLETEHHHQRFVPEEPLSTQRKKHEKLAKDLETATYQRERIPGFVSLAEQLVYNCLLKLARQAADSWKGVFLCPIPRQASKGFQIPMPHPQDRMATAKKGTFSAKHQQQLLKPGEYFLFSSLAVDGSGKVVTDPKSSQIRGILCSFFYEMSEIIAAVVHQLDVPPDEKERLTRGSTRDSLTHCSFSVQMPPPGVPSVLEPESPSLNLQSRKDSRRVFHDIPPSLVPARQPKSVLKALRGIPQLGFSFTTQQDQLASQRARSLLGATATAEVSEVGGVESMLSRRSSVLHRSYFMEMLHNDKPLQVVLRELEAAAELVSEQMESICQQCSWLSDVSDFVRSWKGSEWEYNMLADEFEVSLNQLYVWQSQFVAFPSEILTPYAMFCISNSNLVDTFCSTLVTIQNQIKSGAIQRSRTLCEKVLEETRKRTEVLSAKRYDLEGFADYAHYLRESHSFQAKELGNITFVLKIHSILQRQGIEVPPQDKELGKELKTLWSSFEQKLAEADAFVAKQTPLKAQGLQESIKSSEEELCALVDQVNRGKFVDPHQDPSHLIELLDAINEEVSAVHSRLLGLSKWKEAITGVSHDLSNVNNLLDQVYVRQELWKYRRVFDGYEKRWMSTPFKKLDINLLSTKVNEWLAVCLKFEDTLDKIDPVLVQWATRLQVFKSGMPLLLQLSSKYLKPSHWITIFAALDEEYDFSRQYTLTDFALYNIYDHADIIFEICYDAMQSDKLKAKVAELQKEMDLKKINIVQIPIDFYPFALPDLAAPAAHQKIKFQTEGSPPTKKGPKGTSFSLGFAEPPSSSVESSSRQNLFKLENHAAILMQLENDNIQLKQYLASPHVGALKHRVNSLLDTVSQLQELMHLIVKCQEQWEHLLSLLKLLKPPLRKEAGLSDLQRASDKFQEITVSIRDDPRLLSLVEKRRGQKGLREIQGEVLRIACDSILANMDSVSLKLRDMMDKAVEEFPRLCYLSEGEMLIVMSNMGNPVPLLSIISRVFPAISLVRFTEVAPNKNILSMPGNSTSEEEGFQILFVKDCHQQQLSLCLPLLLGRRPATDWLNGLEYAISYSLASALNETYLSLPALLKGMEVLTEPQTVELLSWLGKHLNQCVLLSMELHWTLVLHSALTSDSPMEQLKLACTKLAAAFDSLSEVLLRWNGNRSKATNFVLQHLILIVRRKSELAQALTTEQVCSVESFRWRSQLLYSTETEDLYNVQELAKKLVVDHGGLISSTQVMGFKRVGTPNASRSPRHSAKRRDSTLVASSRSLLHSRNAALAGAGAGGLSGHELNRSHELSRSQVNPAFRSLGGCTVPLKCFVHCHQTTLPYGFEFLGSEAHLFLTPQTESSLLSLVRAMSDHACPSVNLGPSGRSTTGKDLAVALGRHLCIVDCCMLTDAAALRRLLFGSLHTGSLLQLNDPHHLPTLLAIQLGDWLAVVFKALSKLPSFLAARAQARAAPKAEGDAAAMLASTRSTPGPQSQKEASLCFEPIPEQESPRDSTVSRGISRPSPFYSTPDPRAGATPTTSVHSQQSSRRLFSQQSLRLAHVPNTRSSSRSTVRIDWYQILEEARLRERDPAAWFGYGGEPRRSVEVEKSVRLQISPAFGCVLVGETPANAIPEELKSSFRSINIVQPELSYLSEALLVCHGFSAARDLGPIIAQCLQHLKHQLSSCDAALSSSIGVSSLRHIIRYASHLLLGNNSSLENPRLGFSIESRCVMNSILHHFSPQLATGRNMEEDDDDGDDGDFGNKPSGDSVGWNKFRELLRSCFPSCDTDHSCSGDTSPVPQELLDAIHTQLQERHLQKLPSLVEKIKQLHLGLQTSNCVLLTGPSGSGKTTCFRILAAAYQQVRDMRSLVQKPHRTPQAEEGRDCGKEAEFPTVDITVINPGAYSMDELLGSHKNGSPQQWRDGILTSLIRNIRCLEEIRTVTMHPDLNTTLQAVASWEAPIVHWVVLDGLAPLLTQPLLQLIADGELTLKNGSKLLLPKSCRLIVELPSLDYTSPALLSFASLVHCSGDTLSYNAVINTWLDRAPTQHNLSAISAETLATMIRQLLPETLEYLTNINTQHHGAEYSLWIRSQVYGLTETQCLLNLLSAVLERNSPKEDPGVSYTGSGSRSSRGGSVMTDSRASSAMRSYSITSVVSEGSDHHSDDYPSMKELPAKLPMDVDNMSEVSNLDAEMAMSLHVQMAAMLAFAYIWSLGAFVPFSETKSFGDLARDMIMQLPYAVPLPDEGSIFDYFLDLKSYHFIPWAERKRDGGRRSSSDGGYVALPELDRFAYLADLYISYGFDVIMTGERGTGRTSFVNNLLKSRLSMNRLAISHLLTPLQLQLDIKEKLAQMEKKSGHRFLGGGKRPQQKHAFFLDDIHLASALCTFEPTTADRSPPSPHSNSPLLELIRYMLGHRKLTDFARAYEHLLGSKFVATSTPGDYWRLPVRFTRSMCRIPFLPPSDECLHKIFAHSIKLWLEAFPLGDVAQVSDALSAASVTVYRSVSVRFSPSTLRPHYLITMHHFLSVFEGLLLLSPDTKAQTRPQFSFFNRRGFQSSTQTGKSSHKKPDPKLRSGRRLPSISGRKSKRKSTLVTDQADPTVADSTLRMLIRLWSHESTRVYLDRNVDSKERIWFLKLLESCIKYCFCGVGFEENVAGTPGRPVPRQMGGHTAGLGKRVRGSRMRGGAMAQALPVADGLNAEELAGNGVKVDTLRKLLAKEKEEEGGSSEGTNHPPKLISLDQVIVRGEDLTGLLFAEFPSCPSGPASTDELPSSASSGLDRSESAAQAYSELGDGQVMEVLSKHLQRFQGSLRQNVREEEERKGEEGESSPSPSPNPSPGQHSSQPSPDTIRRSSPPDPSSSLGQQPPSPDERSSPMGHSPSPSPSPSLSGESCSSIVLYREAIEHCARLYRVMNLPGANALLLGLKGSGRKSLMKLMAFIKQSKVIELHCGRGADGDSNFKESLREACISAAMDKQHTVLMVSNHSVFSFQEWDNLATVMSEGLYPGLFTSSELLVMSGKMQAGKMKRTAQIAYQAFSKAVSMNLHVFVLWDLDSVTGSMFSARRSTQEGALGYEASLRALFQSLYQRCAYVDCYRSWSKHAYSEIAMQWWMKESSAIRWQEWTDTSSQLEAISSLAAHVHIVTSDLLTQAYGELGRHLVTPRLFLDCLTMTQNIAIKIKEKEKSKVARLQAALKKLEAVDEVVSDLQQQLASLRPDLSAAEREAQEKMVLITAAKERYMEANSRCKAAEETIDYETSNVQRLALTVEDKMNEVTPIYQSSLEALAAVESNDILEVMKYRLPPEPLTPIFNAFCMLFDREESWEECQQLMMTEKFVDSLQFYDRDHLPKYKVHRLEKILRDNSQFKGIGRISRAAVPLTTWLKALLDYHKVIIAVDPLKKEHKTAEETLTNAKKTFVAMQKDMLETKGALEHTVKHHKESVKKTRAIENQINVLSSKLGGAQHILDAMASQRSKWKERLTDISSRIDSVPGHAMLCAAGVCYLARSPPGKHRAILSNWLGFCSGVVPLGSATLEQSKIQSTQAYGGHQQVVRIQKDFSLASHLSEKEERSSWNQENTFPDDSILDRYLASRAFCTLGTSSWPLVFDPYDKLEKYLKASKRDRDPEMYILKSSEQSLVVDLKVALTHGLTVLLYVDELSSADRFSDGDKAFLSRMLLREFDGGGGGAVLHLDDDGSSILGNSKLQLYLVIRGTVGSLMRASGSVAGAGSFLDALGVSMSLDSYVVDLELKDTALEKSMRNFVMAHERPDYQISYKSLLTDLALHEEDLEANREKMLEYALDPKNPSLLLAKDLLGTLMESEAAELAAKEQIREAKKNIHISNQQVLPYKLLSECASIMLTSIQRLSHTLQYFSLHVSEFEKTLADVIKEYKVVKVADNILSIKAHVIHLKSQFMLRVYQKLQLHIFRQHQLFFPLLVALETQLGHGEITEGELDLLGKGLGELDAQLDLAGESNTNNMAAKPQWIADKSWCKALRIQKEIAALRRLSIEVSNASSEWKEYFEMPPSIMAPVPGFGRNCSMGQKMLLWKAFKPEKFYAVIKEFILVTSGGDFVKTRSPSLDEILTETNPRSLTLLLEPPPATPTSPSPSARATLRETALHRQLVFRHCILHDSEGCRELLDGLPVMATKGYWLVLEYCHWLPNCHEVLTLITKKLMVLEPHPEFRVWALIPADYLSKHPIPGCKTVAFQHCSKGSEVSWPSALLLQDFNKLLSSSKHSPKQGLWSVHEPAVTKLRSFLPPLFSEPELAELDPQQGNLHALPTLIYNELQLHNKSSMSLYASLELLVSCLQDEVPLSAQTGRDILSLTNDVIPMSWVHCLPEPLGNMTSLMSAVKLLRARVVFYRRTLHSGTLPSKLNPLLFSSPQDVISSRACSFALECRLSVSSVIVEGKLHAGEILEKQTHSLVLFGLTLCSAAWDQARCCLTPLQTGDSVAASRSSYCAVISFKLGAEPHSRAPTPGVRTLTPSSSKVQLSCPVVLSNRTAGDTAPGKAELLQQNPLFHVPLPLSPELASEGAEVYLLCDSEFHDAYM